VSISRLLDVLLSNWYILVIAYIVFSGLMGRWKGSRPAGDSPESKPPSAMPPFGGGGGGWPQRKAGAPSEGRRAEESAARQPVAVQKQKQPVEPKPELVKSQVRVNKAPAMPRPAAATEHKGLTKSEQDLVRGVIWAEILGPPRAKKPYRR
jgi:hypothetical protein